MVDDISRFIKWKITNIGYRTYRVTATVTFTARLPFTEEPVEFEVSVSDDFTHDEIAVKYRALRKRIVDALQNELSNATASKLAYCKTLGCNMPFLLPIKLKGGGK